MTPHEQVNKHVENVLASCKTKKALRLASHPTRAYDNCPKHFTSLQKEQVAAILEYHCQKNG